MLRSKSKSNMSQNMIYCSRGSSINKGFKELRNDVSSS